AFYNLGNKDTSGIPKPIEFTAGTAFVMSKTESPAKTSTVFTVNYADIDKPDQNWGGAKPVNIQVNGYFAYAEGGTSVAQSACVVSFNVTPDTTLPDCANFTNVYINECTPDTKYTGSPRNPACFATTGSSVTLKAYTNEAVSSVSVKNDDTGNCSNMSGGTPWTSFSPATSLTPNTQSWSLTTGDGDKKVCIRYTDTASPGNPSTCYAQIYVLSSLSLSSLKVKFQGVYVPQSPFTGWIDYTRSKTVKIAIKTTAGSMVVEPFVLETPLVDAVGGSFDGIFSGPATIPGLAPATYDVYIKGPSHLWKKFANKFLPQTGGTLDLTSQEIPTGDVDGGGRETVNYIARMITGDNQVDGTDVSALLAQYNPLLIPRGTGSGNPFLFDLNSDGFVNSLDYSLIIVYYTGTSPIIGETP
ncbi:MAG: dockerin type I domain-containing protein, partial [bacterium]|nr:dockerin type I domain-containing protein [bacterium]